MGNSADFIYVSDSQIASITKALIIKKKLLVNQEIEFLRLSYNDVNRSRIDSLELLVLELDDEIEIIASNVTELDVNSENISDNDLIANLESQRVQYLLLSQIIADSSENASRTERKKLEKLSEELKQQAENNDIAMHKINDLNSDYAFHANSLKMVQMYDGIANSQVQNQVNELMISAKSNFVLSQNSRKALHNKGLSVAERLQFASQVKEYEQLAHNDQNLAIKLLNSEIAIANNDDLQKKEEEASNQNANESLAKKSDIVEKVQEINSENINTSDKITAEVIEKNNISETGTVSNTDSQGNDIATNENNQNVVDNTKTAEKLISNTSQGSELASEQITTAVTESSNMNNTDAIINSNTNIQTLVLEELIRINPEQITEVQRNDYEIRKADFVGVYLAPRNTVVSEFYTESRAISINGDMPMGLIYKVQIAAFRKPIPQNTFAGIKPITAEKVENSAFTRYFAGMFVNYTNANTAKNAVRSQGYKDAFVVAYFNGKRISITESRRLIKSGEAYTDSQMADNSSKFNIENYGKSQEKQSLAAIDYSDNTGTLLTETPELNNEGVTYSVQVGVFGGTRTSQRLNNAKDLFYDRTSSGYYRYFSGKFNAESNATEARNRIRNNGFSDAFVVAFYQGKRISVVKSRTLVSANNQQINNSQRISDTEIGNKTSKQVSQMNQNQQTEENQNIVQTQAQQKVVNNSSEPGIVYKIQIGAFRSTRNQTQLNTLNAISINGLNTYTNANGLLVYTTASYPSYELAAAARTQIINNGNAGVFIIAFDNGNRISLRDARKR